MTKLHWQGKLSRRRVRAGDFRFELLTSPDVKDVKCREVQLPVLMPASEKDAEERENVSVNRNQALLRAMATAPGASLTALSTATKIHRSSIERILHRLATPVRAAS